MNGSLPGKSKPLLSVGYKPRLHNGKLPEAQFSRALAVSYRKYQLDIWSRLAERFVYIYRVNVGLDCFWVPGASFALQAEIVRYVSSGFFGSS